MSQWWISSLFWRPSVGTLPHERFTQWRNSDATDSTHDKSPPLETLEAEPRRFDSWVTNRGLGWFHNVSYQKESEKDFRWWNILRHDIP